MKKIYIVFMLIAHLFIVSGGASAQSNAKDLGVSVKEACLREVNGTGECVQSGTQIIITAKVDAIKIDSVKINKGNCQNFLETLGMKQFPKSAKFGDQISVIVACNPILVEIESDRGAYEYNIGD